MSVRPLRTPATQTALAPVPQARVSPAPAFPGALADFAAGDYLDELDIGSSREDVVIFDERAVFLDLVVLNIINKDDAVRISHGNGGDMKNRVENVERLIDRLRIGRFAQHRDFGLGEARFAHVDPDPVNLVVSCR